MTWRYEPDLFPGAIGNFSVDVEVAPPPGTVMLFESGNFVLAGAGNTQVMILTLLNVILTTSVCAMQWPY